MRQCHAHEHLSYSTTIMSLSNEASTLRLSVASFARLPGMGSLRTIERPPHSGGRTPAGSSEHSSSRILERDERCFVTKTISYNHEQAHWVNAVRSDRDRSQEVVSALSCGHWRPILTTDLAFVGRTASEVGHRLSKRFLLR